MTGARVAGKVAMVTGAARGVGRACALRLAQEGADVLLLDIGVVKRLETVYRDLGTADELSETADLAGSFGGRVITRYVDVRDGAALRAAAAAAVDRWGSLDILVPAAGVASTAAPWDVSDLQWRTVIDINLTGVWQTAKAVMPAMIAQRRGSIVLIGGDVTHRPASGRSHETAAKYGVAGLLHSLAGELAPHNVRVNSVDPGADDTAGGDPVDVANAVLFLASEEARRVTGASLWVDLGTTFSV